MRRTLFSMRSRSYADVYHIIVNLPRLDEWPYEPLAQPQIAETPSRDTETRIRIARRGCTLETTEVHHRPPHTPDEGGRRSRAATNRRHRPPTRQEGAATRRDEQEVCIAGRRCAAGPYSLAWAEGKEEATRGFMAVGARRVLPPPFLFSSFSSFPFLKSFGPAFGG